MSSRQEECDGICAPAAKQVSKNAFMNEGYEVSFNTDRSTCTTRLQIK